MRPIVSPGESGIYGIFNNETNQIYVGNAQELAKRLKKHIYSDKSNICLKRSISKYGLKTFSIIIFEIYTDPSGRDHTSG